MSRPCPDESSPRRSRVRLSDALTLSLDERAHLAAELLASMDTDEEHDAGAEEAWAAEIDRRAERARSGQSQGTEWSDVYAEALDRLNTGR